MNDLEWGGGGGISVKWDNWQKSMFACYDGGPYSAPFPPPPTPFFQRGGEGLFVYLFDGILRHCPTEG